MGAFLHACCVMSCLVAVVLLWFVWLFLCVRVCLFNCVCVAVCALSCEVVMCCMCVVVV